MGSTVASRLVRLVQVGLVAVLAVLLAGCGGQSPSSKGPVADVSVHDADGLHGAMLPTPYTVPAVALQDTSGATVELATEAKKPLTLVFFGYTNCPDICQVVMANIASALVRLDAEHRRQVAMVFVTTDPARDTGKRLRAYLDRFDRGFHGLTGDLDSIVRLGAALDVPVAKGKKLASGGYDVPHGTQVVGVRPDQSAPFVWTESTAPAALAEDIVKILDDPSPEDDKVAGR